MIYRMFFKRFFDFILALCAIIFLLPLFILIGLFIKIDSRGPVFFIQKRLTTNGKIFSMLKFRSMKINSEHCGTGLFNYENDPRVTRIGRVLRKSSLDELPQLINVLFGQMAIVGPRPPVTYELGDYSELSSVFKKRFRVKAGITGLAQVMGRNDFEWKDKIVFDNIYVDKLDRLGVLLDLKILFLTVISVFRKKNIYEKKDVSLEGLTPEEINQKMSDKITKEAKEMNNNE